MNHEILFKAKRKDNGEWIESLTLLKLNEHLYMFQTAWGEITYDLQYNITAILEGKKPFFVEVIPETVGRYTGLTDMNGDRIFEGDIVKISNKNYEKECYVVRYGKYIDEDIRNTLDPITFECRHLYGWYYQNMNTGKQYGFAGYECNYTTVVDNVWDNPELLKK